MRREAAQAPDPTARQLSIRVMAMPADANAYGDIFGGWLMSQMDIAGSVVAVQIAQGKVATVAVNAMRFIQPVFVGDLVSLYAQLKRAGNSSIKVDVEVFAEREHQLNDLQLVATATLTYVAVDDQRRPRRLKPLQTSRKL
jgi:acyl-CoA thioesterase YciA